MLNIDKVNKYTKFYLFSDAVHILVLFTKREARSFFTEDWYSIKKCRSKG